MLGGCRQPSGLPSLFTLLLQRTNMLFKIGVVLACAFAIFVLISAIYAHISYTLIKMDEERDIS